jgi:hypothetical protein
LAKTNFKIAARELPPRSLRALRAALIISEYFGCAALCDDFALLVVAFFFFGDGLALLVFGADEAIGAVVPSVIVDDVKF